MLAIGQRPCGGFLPVENYSDSSTAEAIGRIGNISPRFSPLCLVVVMTVVVVRVCVCVCECV